MCDRVDEDQIVNAMLNESFADYDSGQYSPQYLSPTQLEPGTLVTTEEDDAKRIAFARLQVQGTGKGVQVQLTRVNSSVLFYLLLWLRLSLNDITCRLSLNVIDSMHFFRFCLLYTTVLFVSCSHNTYLKANQPCL